MKYVHENTQCVRASAFSVKWQRASPPPRAVAAICRKTELIDELLSKSNHIRVFFVH